LWVENCDLGTVVGQLLCVDSERQAALSGIWSIAEEHGEHVWLHILAIFSLTVVGEESVEVGCETFKQILHLFVQPRVGILVYELSFSKLDIFEFALLDKFVNAREILHLAVFQNQDGELLGEEEKKALILFRLEWLGVFLVLVRNSGFFLLFIHLGIFFFLLLCLRVNFLRKDSLHNLNDSGESLIVWFFSRLVHHCRQNIVAFSFCGLGLSFLHLRLLLLLVQLVFNTLFPFVVHFISVDS